MFEFSFYLFLIVLFFFDFVGSCDKSLGGRSFYFCFIKMESFILEIKFIKIYDLGKRVVV